MTPVAIGLGTNLGDRTRHLRDATEKLGKILSISAVSPIYETAPMYVTDQPAFLNGALLGTTELGPLVLLNQLKNLEREIGRLQREKNGPREIDLDLLVFGSAQLVSISDGVYRLQIPHPRSIERRFVLQPLFDLDENLVLPGLGRVSTLLAATNAQADSVVRLTDASLPLYSHRT